MARIVLFNKPFQVLSQFTSTPPQRNLAEFGLPADVYPAGRLDYDSEGLLVLTDSGPWQARISEPRHKMAKVYCAQVEGLIDDAAIAALQHGVTLKDGPTLPTQARRLETAPALWPRNPPIRYRAHIPTSWLEIVLREGRNRQVRRMTAAVGFPTLRLCRMAIGDWRVEGLAPGEWREMVVPEMPTQNAPHDSRRQKVKR